MSHRNAVRSLCLALGVSLVVVAGSEARPGKKNPSPFAAQIKELHAAHALMAKADHDYKGHRVKAMKDVHAAVVALRGTTAAGKKKGAGKGTKNGGGLPQAESDALLKQALTAIQTVQSQLANVQDPRAATAATDLTAAVKELQTALQIK